MSLIWVIQSEQFVLTAIFSNWFTRVMQLRYFTPLSYREGKHVQCKFECSLGAIAIVALGFSKSTVQTIFKMKMQRDKVENLKWNNETWLISFYSPPIVDLLKSECLAFQVIDSVWPHYFIRAWQKEQLAEYTKIQTPGQNINLDNKWISETFNFGYKSFCNIIFKDIRKILLACIFHIIISNLWERDLQSVKCPRAFGRSTIWAQFYKIVEKRKCNLFCFRYLRADYNTWWSRKENNERTTAWNLIWQEKCWVFLILCWRRIFQRLVAQGQYLRGKTSERGKFIAMIRAHIIYILPGPPFLAFCFYMDILL